MFGLLNLLYRVVTVHPTTPRADGLGPTRPRGGVAGTTSGNVAGIDACHSCHKYRGPQVFRAHASVSSVSAAAISRSRPLSQHCRVNADGARRRAAQIATVPMSRFNTDQFPFCSDDAAVAAISAPRSARRSSAA